MPEKYENLQEVGEWKCPLCEETFTWSYMDLVHRGGPICPHCDEDLELVKTYITEK